MPASQPKHDHIEDTMTDDFLDTVDPHSFRCSSCAAAVFFGQLIHRRNLSGDLAIDAAMSCAATVIDSLPKAEQPQAILYALFCFSERTGGEAVSLPSDPGATHH
jgi:hypothetical protein